MQKIALGIAAMLGTTGLAHAAQKPAAMNVIPKVAQAATPIALGALIFAALPRDSFKWDGLQIPAVRWISDGIDSGSSTSSSRYGFARVRVNGVVSKILKQNWMELAWKVEFSSDGNEKWGPQKLTIQPGLDGNLSCFGVEAKGCSITPKALSDPRMTIKRVCEGGSGSSNWTAFEARGRDGRAATVSIVVSAGSGGETDWIEMTTTTPKEVCDEAEKNYG